MFKKLAKNIQLPLVIIAAVFLLFIDVFASVMYSVTLKTAYKSIGSKRTERVADSCMLYINSAMTSTYNLSLDDEFVEAFVSHNGATVTAKLNNLCNYSLRINAVTAYTVDGSVYCSTGVTQVPALKQLQTVPAIGEFVAGKEQAISLRTNVMAKIYDNTLYYEDMGVITCCQRVQQEGETVGWLFTDILPEILYDNYIFADNKYDDAVAYISFGESHFRYDKNTEQLPHLGQAKYFKYAASAKDGLFTVTVYESKSGYLSQMALFGGILLATSLVAMALTAVFSAITAKDVTTHLTDLAEKMNTQKIE